MSAVVEVRLVPALTPTPRRELPAVGPGPAPALRQDLEPGSGSDRGASAAGGTGAGPVGGTGTEPSAVGGTGTGPVGGTGTGPSAAGGPGASRSAARGAGTGTRTGPRSGSSPSSGAGSATVPDPGPGTTPAPAEAGPAGTRARPVRPRAAQTADLATCLPVPERLGAAMLATYRHGAAGEADAGPEEGRRAGRAPRRTSALPRGLATGAVNPLDPRQACCLVALAAVEVLAGTRPIAQLARWVTPGVYDALARRAALTAPRSRVLDPAAAQGDLRDADPAAWSRRPSVRRVRACPVDEDTLEASVVVAHAGRVRAVALRLTRDAGRWRASALVVG